MKYLVVTCLVLAAGCSTPNAVQGVASRAPSTTYSCIAPRLERLPVRYTTEQTAVGWRMRIQVFSGPPSGWYSKGTIEYSDGVVVYAPDTATTGIATQEVVSGIRPILRRCAVR